MLRHPNQIVLDVTNAHNLIPTFEKSDNRLKHFLDPFQDASTVYRNTLATNTYHKFHHL